MNGQDTAPPRDEMAIYVAGAATEQLVGTWRVAAEQWAAEAIGGHDLHEAMLAIELELGRRGQPSCLHCCGPSGQHVPGLCETMRAVGV